MVQPGWIAARFRSGAPAPRRPRSGRDGGRGHPTPIPFGSGTPPGFHHRLLAGANPDLAVALHLAVCGQSGMSAETPTGRTR